MLTRKCSRCKFPYPIDDGHTYFAEPLSMCLTCYSRSNGNDGLTTSELLEKAARSRKGRAILRDSNIERLAGNRTERPSDWSQEEQREWQEINDEALGRPEKISSIQDILEKAGRKDE